MKANVESAGLSGSEGHTPLPWVCKQGMSLEGNAPYWIGESANGRHTPFQSVKEENAAFIVKAVNCHDELLAAVKESLECFKLDDSGYKRGPGPGSRKMIRMCKQAIAKAEGK